MGLEFLRRTRTETLVVGALAGGLFVLLGYRAAGAGILVGAAWGAANLWALTGLLRVVTRRDGGATRRSLLLWGGAKFPLLYGGGYAILRWGKMPAESLLAGFSLLFLVWGIEAGLRSLGAYGARPAGEGRMGNAGEKKEGGEGVS